MVSKPSSAESLIRHESRRPSRSRSPPRNRIEPRGAGQHGPDASPTAGVHSHHLDAEGVPRSPVIRDGDVIEPGHLIGPGGGRRGAVRRTAPRYLPDSQRGREPDIPRTREASGQRIRANHSRAGGTPRGLNSGPGRTVAFLRPHPGTRARPRDGGLAPFSDKRRDAPASAFSSGQLESRTGPRQPGHRCYPLETARSLVRATARCRWRR